jgi:hypothetical protein
MTIRFYILPIEVRNGARVPKYFKYRGDLTPPYIDCQWAMKDYGSINMAVICADIADADHNALVLNADVYSFPVNLDQTMTQAQRSTLNTYIEAHGIPGDWLGPGDTFRSVLRVITAMFLYMQRVLTLIGYPADPFTGLTLNTRYSDIPNPLHDALQQGAVSLEYTWTVGNNDQIRKIWKMMADQWGVRPILFGLATL